MLTIPHWSPCCYCRAQQLRHWPLTSWITALMRRLYKRSKDGGHSGKGYSAACQGGGCHCGVLHWSGQPCFRWVVWAQHILLSAGWAALQNQLKWMQHQTRGTCWCKMWCRMQNLRPGSWSQQRWKRWELHGMNPISSAWDPGYAASTLGQEVQLQLPDSSAAIWGHFGHQTCTAYSFPASPQSLRWETLAWFVLTGFWIKPIRYEGFNTKWLGPKLLKQP